MARRNRSKFRTFFVIVILALAGFGGYTLWKNHGAEAKAGFNNVGKAYDALVKHMSKKKK